MLNVQEGSLNWALDHAIEDGDTDLLPTPFEYEAIKHSWGEIREHLSEIDILKHNTRVQRHILAPKSRYGFRTITQLDPFDFLLYTAIVYEIGEDLESRRVDKEDEVVFSYRFSPSDNGEMFDEEYNYKSFIDKTEEIISDASPEYVVVTDISDFYLRIYHHRLENALRLATDKTNHVKALLNLISGWNETETFGIPIGSDTSRMLAEVTITDVDETLLAHNIKFVRYNDDYRIFCDSRTHAYKALSLLANTLFRNHGLTLNSRKTDILSTEEFVDSYLSTPEQRERNELEEQFHQLAEDIGLDSWYDEIDYEELTPEQQQEINSLNLDGLFDSIVSKEEIDIPMAKFVLRRKSQLGDDSLVETIKDNIERLHPVFKDVMNYFKSIRDLSPEEKKEIGEYCIELLEDSVLTELDFHRVWILDLFTHTQEYDNEDKFITLLSSFSDLLSRRKLILALGRAQKVHWFQSQWRSLFEESEWPKRALLLGSSCLPPDARKHWYKSVEPRLDELEKSILKYAQQNPFYN